ncbi:MAG: type II 3-dehydroquinate dehydratase [Candidatus Dormiibacterota bacterium]
MNAPRRRLLVIDGPNLDLLGEREPGVYGAETLQAVRLRLAAAAERLGCEVSFAQSNDEGQLIELVHGAPARAEGLIINPGALAHYSYSLRDALAAVELPVVEVHISNVFAREEFRRQLVLAPVVRGLVIGLGTEGYVLALEALARHLSPRDQGS